MHTIFISSGQQIHNCQKWNRVFSVCTCIGPHWPSCNLKRIVAVRHFFIHIHINNNKHFNVKSLLCILNWRFSDVILVNFKRHVFFFLCIVYLLVCKACNFEFQILIPREFSPHQVEGKLLKSVKINLGCRIPSPIWAMSKSDLVTQLRSTFENFDKYM